MTKTQAKHKLMERMGYDRIDLPTLKNVHPGFIRAKDRLIKSVAT
tara:strand:+ start:670 stop:804 length:135 start_codon:yes stop_codon:yes gene_type:complete